MKINTLCCAYLAPAGARGTPRVLTADKCYSYANCLIPALLICVVLLSTSSHAAAVLFRIRNRQIRLQGTIQQSSCKTVSHFCKNFPPGNSSSFSPKLKEYPLPLSCFPPTKTEAVEKKKVHPVGLDSSSKKREKNQRSIERLEKDLADAMKDLQALATPSKLAVTVLVMAVMVGINKT